MDGSWIQQIDFWYVRLLTSVVLGSLLGFERFFEGKPAGLRTMALVCTGSAAFMIMGERLQLTTAFAIDPTRIAQGVITGIGFLGAGTILQHRGGIRGLTTAATVWMTAAVGMAAGTGAYDLAALGTGLGLLILQGYGILERWMRNRGLRARASAMRDATAGPNPTPPAQPERMRRRRRRRPRDSRGPADTTG